MFETALTEEQTEYQEMLKRCPDDLLSLVDHILDFPSGEANNLSVESVPLMLTETIEGVRQSFGLQAKGKGLRLVCQVSPEVPDSVTGDPTRLRRLLVQLVSNSIKVTATGEIEIRVEQISAPLPEIANLSFSFRDTGIGIPLEKQCIIY